MAGQELDYLRKRARYIQQRDPFEEIHWRQAEFPGDTLAREELRAGLQHMRKESAILTELGDTHVNLSWEDFKDIICGYGFEIIVSERFVRENDVRQRSPEQVIAAHRQKSLLLSATSYTSTRETINGGSVWGAIDFGRNDDAMLQLSFSLGLGGTSTVNDGPPFLFDFDVRAGLVTTVQAIEESFSLVSWQHPMRKHHVQLAHHGASQSENISDLIEADRRALKQFLKEAPAWVKDFMAME